MKFTDFQIYLVPTHWQLWPLWFGIGDKWCDVKKLLFGPLVIQWRWHKPYE